MYLEVYGKMASIRLWEVRHKRGITLRELESMTGLGKTTLNNIENERVSPTIYEVEKICKALNVTFKELFNSEYNP